MLRSTVNVCAACAGKLSRGVQRRPGVAAAMFEGGEQVQEVISFATALAAYHQYRGVYTRPYLTAHNQLYCHGGKIKRMGAGGVLT